MTIGQQLRHKVGGGGGGAIPIQQFRKQIKMFRYGKKLVSYIMEPLWYNADEVYFQS